MKQPPKERFWQSPIPYLSLFFGALLLSLGAAARLAPVVVAQEAVDEASEPLREAEREAPSREPIILSTEQAAEGSIRTIIELPAVADTYIASGRPDENFGAAALFLGYNLAGDHYGAQRMLLRFDIENNVPPGAVINAAQLRLRLSFSSPADDEPMGTVLRRLASEWGEFSVTWNTEPVWTPIDDTAEVGSEIDWYDWEIPEVVAGWTNEEFENYGLMIIGDETVQQRERSFYSRETLTEFYPRLIIDYTEAPPVSAVDPLPEYSPAVFTVSWSAEDQSGTGIAHYDLQYRVNEGEWIDWLTEVTFTEHLFEGANGNFYEFRARAVDNAGNVEPYGDADTGTTVDAQAPVSSVNPLPPIVNTSTFTVSWLGDDGDGSGIQYYDVHYQYQNGPWILWQQQTIGTSATFTAAADGLYAFEARAVDNVGNVEPFTNEPEGSTIVDAEPPFIEPRIWLPIIFRE